MTGAREAVSLGWPPSDPAALGDFPRDPLAPGRSLWRVVRKGRGPWWFGSSGHGRFDLPAPEGTCYLADDELSALLEAIGPDRSAGAVSNQFLDVRGIRRLHVPTEKTLADLTSRRCAGFGLTLEVHTLVPYDRPRAWAASLRRTGVDGLLYHVRHDPGAGKGVALFGRQGERTSWRRGRERPIGLRLVERLERECGITVIDVPRYSELEIVSPPRS